MRHLPPLALRLLAAAALAWCAAARAQVGSSEVVLGMAAPLSGPAKEIGRAVRTGIEVALAAQNEAGGVHGRRLVLVAVDDGFEPARTATAMRELVEARRVFAIVANVGTATAEVAVPYANEKGVLFFGALSGAKLLRHNPPDRFVFNFRASYAEETAAIVRYLVEVRRIRPERIAVFAQADAFGDAGFEGVARILRQYRRDPAKTLRVRYRRNTADVEEAVRGVARHAKELGAVVMIATYKAAARFVERVRDAGIENLVFTNVSDVDANALADELAQLGPGYADGVVVTQVVPHAASSATTILRYQAELRANAAGASDPQGLDLRLVGLRDDLVVLDEIAFAPLHLDVREVLPLAVPRHDGCGEPALLPGRHPLDERDRPEDALRLEPRPPGDVVLEERVLHLGAPDDELRAGREPEVTPGREEDDVVLDEEARRPRRLARVEHVEELPREALVGEVAAPAGRLREVRDAELARELELALARAATDRLEPRAVHDPLLLGDRRREELRRERAQEPAVEAALALDGPHRVSPLALRALPEHLAREDEVRPLRLHDLLRLAHHEDAAVDARVRVRAVAVAGVDEHIEVGRPRDVHVLDLDLEVGRRAERLVARHRAVGAAALAALRLGDAEPGVEVDRLHGDPLPLNERERERGVEPARDHRDRLARSRRHVFFLTKLFQAAPSRNVPRCSLRVALHHIGMSIAIPGSTCR